jgi:UDP-N-acetylglucosamine 2-epimerase (hydrolysing)
LLKEANFIIGNSSAGVREAPYYKVPIINVGSRQHNRVQAAAILNVDFEEAKILEVIANIPPKTRTIIDISEFGEGNSNVLFLHLLRTAKFWQVNCQKQFQDL